LEKIDNRTDNYLNTDISCQSDPAIKGQASLESLLAQYKKSNEPIQVDFRKLADWIPYGERASHMIHLYPAKLLPHIPAFFLSNNVLSQKGDFVLDPFSGSGTVLLEAVLAERKAIGADSNPLARLISIVKTNKYDVSSLNSSFLRLKKRIEKNSPITIKPDVVNINFWFHDHIIEQLSRIKQAINAIRNKKDRAFFEVSFSNTIKRSSLADPRLSVPVKLNIEKYKKNSPYYLSTKKTLDKLENLNVYELFYSLTTSNINRIEALNKQVPNLNHDTTMYNDARHLSDTTLKSNDNSVQLVITSPPYAGAQKYIRSSGLNLGWLGKCASNNLRHYEKLNIGREHHSKSEYINFTSSGIQDADTILESIYNENPLRAHITSKYLLEMNDAFKEIFRILKPGGFFVLVSSANKICDTNFKTHEHLCTIAISLGLKVRLRLIDEIHSRGLMTKRNKTAGIINCEWVYIFEKE